MSKNSIEEPAIQKDTLVVGDIFNKIYRGPNEAYSKCNGKTTNVVTKIEGDKIEYREIYSSIGNETHPKCISNTITWTISRMMQSEYEIIKIDNPERDGFIHKKALLLGECYELGILNKDHVCNRFKSQEGHFMKRSPITTHRVLIEGATDGDFETKHSFTCLVQPFTHPEYPYLTSAVFIYNSVKELYDDVDSVFGVECLRYF